MAKDQKETSSSFKLYCAVRCFQKPSSPEREEEILSDAKQHQPAQKKPGGWRAMPYILGNETCERLATLGLVANFMVYLTREFHMDQASAANVLNIWGGMTCFLPLLGAFISDTYTGRFRTIAVASVASILGMITVTITAWLPGLQPPKCDVMTNQAFGHECKSASSTQLGILLMGLGLLSIGTGGIRPCSIPFGVDQFDPTTEEGVKGINSFFNLYYTTFTVVIMISQTVVVYIQDSVSWVIGFGIPAVLMIASIILFLVGKKLYIIVEPEGSIFSGIAQVLVSAFKKRRLTLPDEDKDDDGIFYDPPFKLFALSKLPLTNQFRFLSKAAMIVDDELKPDGTPINRWRLCSIQQVEEVKCLFKVFPIWTSGVISIISMTQQGTFTVSQATKMNRHLGHNKFQIPAGSITVISMFTIGIWLPLYDKIIVPALRKITKHEGGITVLQRIGIGNIFSILSMIVAGVVERERRGNSGANANAPLSILWLAPQLILMGFCEAFNIIGQIEFYNKQFPDHMKSIANSLIYCSFGGASYLSSLLIVIVRGVTGRHGHPDWLANDINAGRLDCFYFLIAVLVVINFIYFLYCATRYRYKVSAQLEEKPYIDLELVDGPIKP